MNTISKIICRKLVCYSFDREFGQSLIDQDFENEFVTLWKSFLERKKTHDRLRGARFLP